MTFHVAVWQRNGVSFTETHTTLESAMEAMETATSVGMGASIFEKHADGRVGRELFSNVGS